MRHWLFSPNQAVSGKDLIAWQSVGTSFDWGPNVPKPD